MSVCTRKDGQVFVQWKEGGKTRRKYFGNGPDSREQARQYNAVVTRRTVTGGSAACDSMTWSLNICGPGRRQCRSNRKVLGYKLVAVIVPAIGHLQVQNITPERLDRYVSERSKTVKNSTIHRELSDIRAILNWSVRRRLIHSNPMAGFRLPAKDAAVIMPVTYNEIQRILDHSVEHLRRAMLLSFFLGLRPGAVELLSMRYN